MAPSAKAKPPGAFGAEWLEQRLRQLLRRPAPQPLPALAVAFSGGADSTALLHAAARGLPAGRLRAIHVDHGLHEDSAAWARHCLELADALAIPCLCVRVTVAADDIAGQGVEAAARKARYAVLAAELDADEMLLTAQHREDQLETVLLQLMRGAGLAGLSAMAPVAGLGRTCLLRPLLELARVDLTAYLESHGVGWLEDPANRDLRFDRSFLRSEILPRLRRRWPAADTNGARSAAHLAAGASLLRQLAAADLARCDGGDGRIHLSPFRRLSRERQRNALRHWVVSAGYRSPGHRRLESVLDDVVAAGVDAMPLVALGDAEIRRYRDRLHLLPAESLPGELPERIALEGAGPVVLPGGLGTLRFRTVRATGLDPRVLEGRCEIRFRAGGERLVPAAGRPRRRLKHLLQEAGVVPWMRDRIPLIYCGDRLVAVAGLWIDAEYERRGGLVPSWEGHPPLF